MLVPIVPSQIALNLAFQHFLPSVSGGKSSLSGGWSRPLPTSVGENPVYTAMPPPPKFMGGFEKRAHYVCA